VRLLLIVHMNNRRLPDERADLFDKAINALLQVDYGREEGDIRELSTDWKPFRDMAQHLALHMHRQGPDQGREIEEPGLKAALRQEAQFAPRVDDFLGHARQRGSVLEERDGAYRFIHLGFVPIPADPAFRIGTRKADAKRVAEIIGYDVPKKEINDQTTPTEDFYIARYPVTVAQFRAFVAASGFEPGVARALRDPDNRPVRYVDWHEALAYCNWLNETLANVPILDGSEVARLVREGSWRVGLPSELQWEKAARGGLADAVFSWGDTPDSNRANYRDSEIGDTSSVGCFPANGFGLHDMIGNLWEWTRSRYAPYPYQRDDGREHPDPKDDDWLVVRGGAWGRDRGSARCAYRGRGRPDDRSGGLGFRVLLGSAPVP
jgi:formylglycine-generating enzyme required for sulfatase activity